jgi:hypothetical protein
LRHPRRITQADVNPDGRLQKSEFDTLVAIGFGLSVIIGFGTIHFLQFFLWQ